MRTVYLLLLIAVAGCSSLAEKIEERVRAEPGALVAVVYRELETGASFEREADVLVHAASTMKLPVMIELFRSGDLEEALLVENRFRSVVDGSAFAVDAKDDADPWTHEQVGKRVPVRSLVERMIVRSSNLATNLLIARADPARVTSTCRALGASRIEVRRGVEDLKAFDAGIVNETTARDLAALLEALARGATSGSNEMIAILARQELNEGIPSGLTPGLRCAHKTGAITKHYHDAALVLEGDRPSYVLVVLTKGLEEDRAVALVRDVSRIVVESR